MKQIFLTGKRELLCLICSGQRDFLLDKEIFCMKKYIVFGSKRLFVLEQEFIFTFDKDLFTGVSTVGRTRKISKRCKEKRST